MQPRCFAYYFVIVTRQQLQQCWATVMTSMLLMAVIEADETLHTSEIASHKIVNTRKRGNCECLQLEAARATPVLFGFNYDAMPSWKSLNLSKLLHYSVFVADTLLYAVTLTFDL